MLSSTLNKKRYIIIIIIIIIMGARKNGARKGDTLGERLHVSVTCPILSCTHLTSMRLLPKLETNDHARPSANEDILSYSLGSA